MHKVEAVIGAAHTFSQQKNEWGPKRRELRERERERDILEREGNRESLRNGSREGERQPVKVKAKRVKKERN